MIDKNLSDYLNMYILKKDEQLGLNHIVAGRLMDIPIVKSTKRTLRKTGILTIGIGQSEENVSEIDSSLKSLKATPRKKLLLDDDNPKTLQWLEEGWILKEIRLKQDGKTVASQNYRMGFKLFKYEQNIEEQQNEKIKNELQQLKNDLLKINLPLDYPYIKQKMFDAIKEKYVSVCEIDNLKDTELFPRTWSINKRMKFLHFMLAFVQLSSSKQQFDWKEIGAFYYKEIGGSKVFDRNQDEFLETLEEWSGFPAVELGLTSLGHITPVFFSGQLEGHYSTYKYGPVHSVTNISIEEDKYTTSASTFWIVENRGILTRLSSEKGLLEEASTFVLCCDGHIRSAHRHFIEQILQTSDLNQVIIWTDYDQDGMTIAKELYTIVEKEMEQIKWISPTGDVHKNWADYERDMKEFLEKNTMEQEEMTGDGTLWKKWIKN